MAQIKVDHQYFSTAADSFEEYANEIEQKMNSIESEMSNLKTYWSGKDYDQAYHEWEEMKADDSTASTMKKTMSSYADILRQIGEDYKQVQTDAVNRANRLRR